MSHPGSSTTYRSFSTGNSCRLPTASHDPVTGRNSSTLRQYSEEDMPCRSSRVHASGTQFCFHVAAIILTATAVLQAATDPRMTQVERDVRPVDRAGNATGRAKSLLDRMAELKVPG